MPGFFCGRYDLKAKSIEELYAGNFKVLELNGVISEPTRMYDPSRNFRKAYKVMFYHRKLMYLIGKENRRRGIPYIGIKEGRRIIKKYGM
ncbi:hypothetical protein KBC03_07495 [Patescibacteria group bacterium]|nr:hypothetical protein [Patescibacteria group bacterium]